MFRGRIQHQTAETKKIDSNVKPVFKSDEEQLETEDEVRVADLETDNANNRNAESQDAEDLQEPSVIDHNLYTSPRTKKSLQRKLKRTPCLIISQIFYTSFLNTFYANTALLYFYELNLHYSANQHVKSVNLNLLIPIQRSYVGFKYITNISFLYLVHVHINRRQVRKYNTITKQIKLLRVLK